MKLPDFFRVFNCKNDGFLSEREVKVRTRLIDQTSCCSRMLHLSFPKRRGTLSLHACIVCTGYVALLQSKSQPPANAACNEAGVTFSLTRAILFDFVKSYSVINQLGASITAAPLLLQVKDELDKSMDGRISISLQVC